MTYPTTPHLTHSEYWITHDALSASIVDLQVEASIAETSKARAETHLAEAQARYDAAQERAETVSNRLGDKVHEKEMLEHRWEKQCQRVHADRVVTEVMEAANV